MAKPTKPKNDPLHKLKLIGYRAAFGSEGDLALKDFIRFAKTYLCLQNNVLFKDPIWDSYGDEEILVEYFAHVFTKDKDKRAAFEETIKVKDSTYDDFLEFANQRIKENARDLEDQAKDMKDSVSFKPDLIGE